MINNLEHNQLKHILIIYSYTFNMKVKITINYSIYYIIWV